MALMAAAVIRPSQAHVFGCPRVGNRVFVDNLASVPVYRYEASFDPVTWVPPRTSPVQAIYALAHGRLPTLYRHAGRRVGVDARGHSMDGYQLAMLR